MMLIEYTTMTFRYPKDDKPFLQEQAGLEAKSVNDYVLKRTITDVINNETIYIDKTSDLYNYLKNCAKRELRDIPNYINFLLIKQMEDENNG